MRIPAFVSGLFFVLALATSPMGDFLEAGEPGQAETLFSTFSLCAIDPDTGECGVAVTTRVPFVGQAVPWVEAGVGAVATQSWTRVEYGPEGLALLREGVAPKEVLARMMAPDQRKEFRQVGLINMKGEGAAFTGEECGAWAGSRQGPNYTVQANIMVGPEVVQAVADHFEKSAGQGMPLAERMILAMEAGQKTGGDLRWGRLQSAAIKIANPKIGGRRNDHVSLDIQVGEHEAPVQEMKRIYYKTQQKLGYRAFSEVKGPDVVELKQMLHALGYWRKDQDAFPAAPEWDGDPDMAEKDPDGFREKVAKFRQVYDAYMEANALFDEEVIAAVDAFREANKMAYEGNPRGLVDTRFVEALKAAYAARSK